MQPFAVSGLQTLVSSESQTGLWNVEKKKKRNKKLFSAGLNSLYGSQQENAYCYE